MGYASQCQDLEVVAQCVADRGIDGVRALAGVLGDDVADIVDGVGVVAEAALHRIGAGTTIKLIISFSSLDAVIATTSVNSVVAPASQKYVTGVHAGVLQHVVARAGQEQEPFQAGNRYPVDRLDGAWIVVPNNGVGG